LPGDDQPRVHSHDTCWLDGSSVNEVKADASESQAAYSRIATVVKEVFLPQGYPDSVHSDYTAYQIWDTIQVSLNSRRTRAKQKGIARKLAITRIDNACPAKPINFTFVNFSLSSRNMLWNTRCCFTLQAFASTIMGTLTTHSIMRGIGVGESNATPLAAAITWILKNGTGMVGSILFAWWNG